MDYLLAYDVGTTGTKAVLTATDGRVIAAAFESYAIHYPRKLWAEQDPEDWWRAIGNTGREVLGKSGARPNEVLGLAFSTPMVNVIALDGQARMLRPCISWLAGRAREEAGLVMRRIGGPTLFAAVWGPR